MLWAHEYMDICVNIDGHRMWGHLERVEGMYNVILTKLSQHVNDMMAVVKKFRIFDGPVFLYNQTKR